jgi:hypothetical protein
VTQIFTSSLKITGFYFKHTMETNTSLLQISLNIQGFSSVRLPNQGMTILLIFIFIKFLTASVVLWSELLATDPEVQVRFLGLPDFPRSSGSGKGSTQPLEYNCGVTRKKKIATPV